MNKEQFTTFLKKEDACKDSQKWAAKQLASGKTLADLWQTCERGDWMLSMMLLMLNQPGWHNRRQLTLAKARCAKLVLHLMKDERSRNAVLVAEQYGLGNATDEELEAARKLGAAAFAAAAAAAATRMITLKKCADEIRACVPQPGTNSQLFPNHPPTTPTT